MIHKLLLIIVSLLGVSAAALTAQTESRYADSLEQLLPEIQQPSSRLQLLTEISEVHADWEAYEKSKHFAYLAIALAQKTEADPSTLELPLLLLANAYYEQQILDSLHLVLPEILRLCTQSENTDCLIEYYNTIAVLYDVSSHPDSSIYFYQKALEMAENEPLWQDLILNNMGVIFSSLKLSERARTYYRRAYVLALEADDTYIQGLSLLNIAYTFIEQRHVDSAKFYLANAHTSAVKSEYIDLLADVHCYMGLCHLKTQELHLADSFLHLALQSYTLIGLDREIAETLPYLSELYFEQGLFEQAKATALHSIQFNKDSENQIYLLGAYQILSKLCRVSEDFQMADQYTQAYNDLQDSIQQHTLSNQFSTLEMDYQLYKTEAQLELLTVERKNELRVQKFALLGTGALLLFLGTIIYLLFHQSKRRRQLNQKLESQVSERTADLNKSNEELKNYIEELRSFTHITSHDLKEPLRNISSFTSLLERRMKNELTLEAIDFMREIKANAHQMHRLIEGILYYSTLDAKNNDTASLSGVNLGLLLDEIERILATTIQEHHAIILYPDTLPTIVSSPEALQVVIKNLIENGIKYNRSDQPTVSIHHQMMADKHHIIVKDNGIGIEPQYQQQVFQMFKRLHNQQEFTGTGMGLAICRKLLRRLDGDIQLESEDGQGSIFTIILPVATSSVEANSI